MDDKIFDQIQQVDLKKTMESSYIDYAMSVIASRARRRERFMCEVNHFSYINSNGDMRYCSYGERKDDKHEH